MVIGIIAIMAAMAVPTMTATRGNAPSTGAAEVANVLTLARQKAVTSRSHVMVIFPTNASTFDLTDANSIILPRVSYTVLQEKVEISQVNAESRNWQFIERWHHLPRGAFFPPNGCPGAMPILTLITNAGPPLAGIDNLNIPYIQFNARGEVISDGPRFAVQQGTVSAGSLIALSTNAANTVSGIVYRITGAVKVYR
ncbi:MAG: hypothetical protein HY360_03045 [Verrucomicrobia bacterium]|nr:hypothetical protein [Verrucomicrobiota bacterium]